MANFCLFESDFFTPHSIHYIFENWWVVSLFFSSQSSLDTFNHFVAVPDPVNGKLMITAGEMSDFITSINGMKVSKISSEILLHKMLEKNDYNDGSDQKVSIRIERFNNEVIGFAKKKSLFKSSHLKN